MPPALPLVGKQCRADCRSEASTRPALTSRERSQEQTPKSARSALMACCKQARLWANSVACWSERGLSSCQRPTGTAFATSLLRCRKTASSSPPGLTHDSACAHNASVGRERDAAAMERGRAPDTERRACSNPRAGRCWSRRRPGFSAALRLRSRRSCAGGCFALPWAGARLLDHHFWRRLAAWRRKAPTAWSRLRSNSSCETLTAV